MKSIIKEEISSIIRQTDDSGNCGKSGVKHVWRWSLFAVVFNLSCVVCLGVAKDYLPLQPVEYDTLRNLVAMVAAHEGRAPDQVWRDLYVECRVGGKAELRYLHFNEAQAWLNSKLEG